MDGVKVIVFTMAYNAAGTLRRTLDSILAQTYQNFEYYVLDNGSTDGTEAIIIDYAEADRRVIPLHINKNDPTNGFAFFNTVMRATDAKYSVWCDADDEYTPDFLENMVVFAEENRLDIAACGYKHIDGQTGGTLKHRALEENLILSGGAFTEEFVRYRAFTLSTWGKLYSIPFLKKKNLFCVFREERVYNDSIWSLHIFREAERAGIYGKAMYLYYQYPRSLFHANIEGGLDSYPDLWAATQDYIASYGPVSKRNADFLQAVHLSLVDEDFKKVMGSERDVETKLKLLERLFGSPAWAKTLAWDADPEFRNLAARGAYVQDVKQKIAALSGVEAYGEALENIFAHLTIRKEEPR